MSRKITVLIVDDHTLFAESLKLVIQEKAPDLEVVDLAFNGVEAVDKYIRHRPEVVLMDVRMPKMDGVQATQKILEMNPKAKVLMLTTFDDDAYVTVALRFGAAGYLLKNIATTDLINAVRSIHSTSRKLSPEIVDRLLNRKDEEFSPGIDGRRAMIEKLTAREREVMELLLEAKENFEIADQLFISEQTVKNHVHHVYAKLGVNNRVQLIKVMGSTN